MSNLLIRTMWDLIMPWSRPNDEYSKHAHWTPIILPTWRSLTSSVAMAHPDQDPPYKLMIIFVTSRNSEIWFECRSLFNDYILAIVGYFYSILVNRQATKVLKGLSTNQHFFLNMDACCYVYNHEKNKNKFSNRAIKYVFLGYSLSQKGYNFFYLIMKKNVSMHVKFLFFL